MMTRNATLTNRDHINMDAFIGYCLDDFKAGSITKSETVSFLGHVITAIDTGNYDEAIQWFERGRSLIRPGCCELNPGR